jgi:hypothetical protein
MSSVTFPKSNHGGMMVLKNGQSEVYGCIRVKDGFFYYYTEKGLRELSHPIPKTEEQKMIVAELRKLTEEELIATKHIAKIPVNDVLEFTS